MPASMRAERIDVLALRDWVLTHRPEHAVIERAQAMPKQGSSSGFKYGRAVGSIEATVTGCEIPLITQYGSASAAKRNSYA